MGDPPQRFLNTKQLSFQLQDQESSSTQFTSQSRAKDASMKDSNPNGQSIKSATSGFNQTHVKPLRGDTKLASSMGPQDFGLTQSPVDYSQTVAPIQVQYAEPYYSGLLASFYWPQIRHSQMMGMAPARVPLPLDFTEDEPIYVNAKQYRAILRRRQYRAKLEAENKVAKGRKPYLHESRHIHAMKRARGSGGRFLDTKKLHEFKRVATSDGMDVLCTESRFARNESESEAQRESYKDAVSTTSCSDIKSASNSGDIFHQPEFGFSGYPSHHMGRSIQGCSAGLNGDGNLHLFLSSIER